MLGLFGFAAGLTGFGFLLMGMPHDPLGWLGFAGAFGLSFALAVRLGAADDEAGLTARSFLRLRASLRAFGRGLAFAPRLALAVIRPQSVARRPALARLPYAGGDRGAGASFVADEIRAAWRTPLTDDPKGLDAHVLAEDERQLALLPRAP